MGLLFLKIPSQHLGCRLETLVEGETMLIRIMGIYVCKYKDTLGREDASSGSASLEGVEKNTLGM